MGAVSVFTTGGYHHQPNNNEIYIQGITMVSMHTIVERLQSSKVGNPAKRLFSVHAWSGFAGGWTNFIVCTIIPQYCLRMKAGKIRRYARIHKIYHGQKRYRSLHVFCRYCSINIKSVCYICKSSRKEYIHPYLVALCDVSSFQSFFLISQKKIRRRLMQQLHTTQPFCTSHIFC